MPSRRLFSGAIALALAIAFDAVVSAQALNPKVDRGLRNALDSGAPIQHVIVQVTPGCRDFVRQSLVQHGDRLKAEHPIIDALTVDLHSEDVAELASHPCVKTLSLDAPVSAKGRPTRNTGAAGDILRETLGLPSSLTSGTPAGATGIGVAVIDSGIAPSADFAGRITGFYDFTHGGVPVAPYDDYGHGTHVAGLIGSSGKLSGGRYTGIAPGVHLVGFKVLDGTGMGTTSDVIKAIEYIIANRTLLDVQIINISLGHPIYAPASDDPLVEAVEQASAAGLIVVTAAGNQGSNGHETGYTGITSPGNAPSAITVGAVMTQETVTRADDVVAPYSSRGPTWFDAFAKPDLVAPGHGLVSDTDTSSFLFKTLASSRADVNGTSFLSLSGTSMATGVTSGVVALVLQAHHQNGLHDSQPLTPNAVKALLEFSALPVAGADYLTQGAGELNAAGAIDLARSIDTDVRAGSWWLRTAVSPWTTIGNETDAWGENIVWGSTVLSGSVVYTNNIVWGTNIVWGSNIVWDSAVTVTASKIVWGDNVIWGTNLVWRDRVIGQDENGNIVWGTNIAWGTLNASNIVWGTVLPSHVMVFATRDGNNNIVWGTDDLDNIVWGTSDDDDNIVWGTTTRALGMK